MPRQKTTAPAITPLEAQRRLNQRLSRIYPGARSLTIRAAKRVGTLRATGGIIRYNALITYPRRTIVRTLYGNYSTSSASRALFQFIDYLYRHRFNRRPYLVPRPLLYDAQYQIVLYESFPGDRFRDLLEAGHCSERQAQRQLQHAAAWLRQLHALPPGTGKRKTQTGGATLLTKKLRGYLPAAPQLLQATNRALRQAIRQHPLRLVHGDPHLANFIIGPRRSWSMIDYSESYRGCALADIGKFLVHLDVALKPFFLPASIVRLERTVIETYFGKRLAQLRPSLCRDLNAWRSITAFEFLAFTLNINRRPTGYVAWILSRLRTTIVRAAARPTSLTL